MLFYFPPWSLRLRGEEAVTFGVHGDEIIDLTNQIIERWGDAGASRRNKMFIDEDAASVRKHFAKSR